MDTITQLQLNRRIIQDFTSSALAQIENPFSRLAYLASLRDLSSNSYDHVALRAVYPPHAVQQALEYCHLEIFERILESPLAIQEKDLRAHLRSLPKGLQGTPPVWRKLETYRTLLPATAPDYLTELFCSNVRAILELLEAESSQALEAG